MDSDEVYWQSFDLGLTEAQQKKLESLLSAYASEAFPLSMEIMSLRFELRYLIRDSSVQPKILLDRQKKILELQTKLDDLSLSYRIKARSVFIKEQLEQLPPDFLMGMEHGSGVKVGGSRQ
jgi:hypothetical protein